jgi:arylesterase/paraoxonase
MSKGTFQPPHPTKPQDNNGAIYIYNYAKSTDSITPLTFPNWPGATDFHPLGIAFDSTTSTLYVINHRRHSGSVIEIFHVSLSTHSATHTRTFSHPLIPAPNAMHLLGPGKMYISNDHYYRAAQSPLLSKIENFGGFPGGSVVYLDTVAPEESKIVARVPFANGIVDVNATTLAVASSMKPGIYFYEILANKGLEYVTYVRTPAGADNLSKDGNGKVLVAGHPYSPALVGVAKGRVGCDEEGSEEQRRACGCWAPSWVGEWTEEGGLRTLLSDGAQGEKGICSSSTAVRDVGRGVGIVSMLYGKGIAVFRE